MANKESETVSEVTIRKAVNGGSIKGKIGLFWPLRHF